MTGYYERLPRALALSHKEKEFLFEWFRIHSNVDYVNALRLMLHFQPTPPFYDSFTTSALGSWPWRWCCRAMDNLLTLSVSFERIEVHDGNNQTGRILIWNRNTQCIKSYGKSTHQNLRKCITRFRRKNACMLQRLLTVTGKVSLDVAITVADFLRSSLRT